MKRLYGIHAGVAATALLLALFGAASSWPATAFGATASGATSITATALRITDHPAYVRVVVEFSGSAVGTNPQVFATDARPLDGVASLQYAGAGARTTAATRSQSGVTAKVVKNARGLRIELRTAHQRFKYLSWTWATGHRLAVDLWKSAPPSAAAQILRGRGGRLTLGNVRLTRDGVLNASGWEHGVFEHQFRVVIRAADGHVLVQRTVHATKGRWTARLVVRSQRAHLGTFEAVALSPADGALMSLVQKRVTLP